MTGVILRKYRPQIRLMRFSDTRYSKITLAMTKNTLGASTTKLLTNNICHYLNLPFQCKYSHSCFPETRTNPWHGTAPSCYDNYSVLLLSAKNKNSKKPILNPNIQVLWIYFSKSKPPLSQTRSAPVVFPWLPQAFSPSPFPDFQGKYSSSHNTSA
ncbi:hypothetical protein SAMN05216383_1161 [Prevotella sp. KH2C16]|nr:hypothetical protein SAMN05216383_1161 [Prevotella sp. KH2C16]